MYDAIKKVLFKGYDRAIKKIDEFDEYNVVDTPDINQYLSVFESLYDSYKAEFEEQRPDTGREASVYKLAFAVIKTLHHMRLFHPNKRKVEKVYKKNKAPSAGVMYANEMFCWEILMLFYQVLLVAISSEHEYPPYCEEHFEEAAASFYKRFFRSRIRLGEISASYIELQYEALLAQHFNVAHHKTRKMLNKDGFDVYLKYMSKEMIGSKESKISLMLFDIDKFKQVNDDAGFNEGDRIIKEMAEIAVKHCASYRGAAGRIGGEEFWLAFPNPIVDVKNIYEKINNEFKKIPRPKYDQNLVEAGVYKEYMTVSAALTTLKIEKALSEADIRCIHDQLDMAVHEVKDKGRDGFIELNIKVPEPEIPES